MQDLILPASWTPPSLRCDNNNNNNNNNSKRPDDLTLIPWQGVKPVICDVTVASTSVSYTDTSATGAGLVMDQASNRKLASTLKMLMYKYVTAVLGAS